MSELRISNTLVNDTESGIIAYSKQLKDTEINKFQSEINQELLNNSKVKVDLKNFQNGQVLPEFPSKCFFQYDNESVYTVPCIYQNKNCILVHVLLYENNNVTLNKVFLFWGRNLYQTWENNDIPQEIKAYLPNTISEIISKVSNIENQVIWS